MHVYCVNLKKNARIIKWACSFYRRSYFDANRGSTSSSSECIFDFSVVATRIMMSIPFSYFIVELVSYISQIYIYALNLATVCVKTVRLKVHPIVRTFNPFSKSQQQMESCYLGKFRKNQTNKKNLLSRSLIVIASFQDRSSLFRSSSFCK